jgi:hypothetical protein
MMQAARSNALQAAARAVAPAAAAAAAGGGSGGAHADAAGFGAGLQGLGWNESQQGADASALVGSLNADLRGLSVNRHAIAVLQADILPDWESDVQWEGSNTGVAGGAAGPTGDRAAAAAAAAAVAAAAAAVAAQQRAQQEQGHAAGGLPPAQLDQQQQSAAAAPGGTTSSSLPGALSMLAPAGSLLPPFGGQQPAGLLPGLSRASSLLPSSGGHLSSAAAAAAAAAGAEPGAGVAGGSGAASGRGARGGAGGKGRQGASKGASLSKPRKPLEAAMQELRLHRSQLRLMPSIAAAAATVTAAEQHDATAAAAAAAAASGDRAAAAAAALPRAWGQGLRAGGAGGGDAGGGGMESSAAAAAAEQLRLRHVGELVSKDLRPVLPDDDGWMNDVVWDAQDAQEAAAGAQQQLTQGRAPSGGAADDDDQAGGSQQQGQQQQQALVLRQPSQLGVLSRGGARVPVLWDLNDPHLVFEAPQTQRFIHASAVVQHAPPQVCVCMCRRWRLASYVACRRAQIGGLRALPACPHAHARSWARAPPCAQAAAHLPPHLLVERDPLLHQLAPLHISRDHLYAAGERAGGRTTGTGVRLCARAGLCCARACAHALHSSFRACPASEVCGASASARAAWCCLLLQASTACWRST